MIVLSQTGKEPDVIHAFRLGASDYLMLPVREAEVVSCVERALKQVREVRAREKLDAQIKQTNAELQRRVKELGTIFSVGRAVISIGHPFSEYLYLMHRNTPESYHAFKMMVDTWGAGGPNPFKVHYYIRPLNEMIRPILNSKLKLISVDEPLPDENMKKLDPSTYERLMIQPGFIFFVLEK